MFIRLVSNLFLDKGDQRYIWIRDIRGLYGYNAEICVCLNMEIKGFFQFEIIINVLVSSSRFI